MSMMPEPLLSLDDMVAWLGRPASFFYRTRYERRPPGSLAISVGSTLRWKRCVVEEWLDSQQR